MKTEYGWTKCHGMPTTWEYLEEDTKTLEQATQKMISAQVHINFKTIFQKKSIKVILCAHIVTKIASKHLNPLIRFKQSYLWWLKWIIWWEVNGHKEYTTSIRAVDWTHNCSLPMKHVFTNRACMSVAYITIMITFLYKTK